MYGRYFCLDGVLDNGLSAECRHKDLSGHYALVTGANRGIGRELAKLLVQRGCNVVMGCRDETKANAAMDAPSSGQ